jgi:hypothetical protein
MDIGPSRKILLTAVWKILLMGSLYGINKVSEAKKDGSFLGHFAPHPELESEISEIVIWHGIQARRA